MKLLYKPFALIAGVVGAKLGQRTFKAIWSKVDESEPPGPAVEEAPLAKVVGAKALEAATMAAIAAAVDRASARSFQYLTGFWPGPKTQAEEEE